MTAYVLLCNDILLIASIRNNTARPGAGPNRAAGRASAFEEGHSGPDVAQPPEHGDKEPLNHLPNPRRLALLVAHHVEHLDALLNDPLTDHGLS